MGLLDKMQSVRGYRVDFEVVVKAGKRQINEQVNKTERNISHKSCKSWSRGAWRRGSGKVTSGLRSNRNEGACLLLPGGKAGGKEP